MVKKKPTRKPDTGHTKSCKVLIRFSPPDLQAIDAHLQDTHEPRESFCRRAIIAQLLRDSTKGGKK